MPCRYCGSPSVDMLAPVTLRTFPPIGYSSLPGVENMPWVRDNDRLSLERPAPDGNVSLLTARWRAEAIVNRTGGRWRARKAAGLQDRCALLLLISGNNRQIELCSDPLTVRIVPFI